MNDKFEWDQESILDRIESRVGVVPQESGKVYLPVFSDPNLTLITTSELKCFRRCKRKHLYNYRQGYREINKAGPLRFGTAVHEALEVWWSPRNPYDLTKALEAIDRSGEIDEFERAKARAMMLCYHARWSSPEFKVIGVEVEFTAPLINPDTNAASKTFRVGGKIDAIVQKPSGYVYIVEHKTCGVECGFDSPYWKMLRLDAQISTYFVGARALGFDVAGCIYDVLRKPAIRPLKCTPVEARKYTKPTAKEPVARLYANQREVDETPDEFEERCLKSIAEDPDRFLMRGEVLRTEEDELDAAYDLWQNAKELRESEKAKRFPKNPEACLQWGRFCEFFDKCTGIVSLDDQTRFRRTMKKHEELSL